MAVTWQVARAVGKGETRCLRLRELGAGLVTVFRNDAPPPFSSSSSRH